jgi:flagellin-like hook-associated protein FlgL
MATISLTSQMTANLLSLQNTAKLLGITQERLATGKKVNSAIDDPVAFFDADAHYQLANDYAALKNGMSEAIQTVQAAANGIDSLKSILAQMKSIATAAKSAEAGSDELASLEDQYTTLVAQYDDLAVDSGYKGVNLLEAGSTLDVVFSVENYDDTADPPTGALRITGFDASSAGTALLTAAPTDWNSAIGEIDAKIAELRTQAKIMAANLNVVTERQNFTDKMIATLKTGADNLTLADMNEEGANMLMLQTRQALGIQSLSMASQAAQQVLSLFQ